MAMVVKGVEIGRKALSVEILMVRNKGIVWSSVSDDLMIVKGEKGRRGKGRFEC